jgi:hypothetical protein
MYDPNLVRYGFDTCEIRRRRGGISQQGLEKVKLVSSMQV